MRVAEPSVLAFLAVGILVALTASLVPQSRRWMAKTAAGHAVMTNVAIGASVAAGFAAGQIAALGWDVLVLALACGLLVGSCSAGLRILVRRRQN